MPLLRALGECKSAIIAVDRLTFPLLIPPMILERRKTPKVREAAQSEYDAIKPICRSKKGFFIKQCKVGAISAHFPAKHLHFLFVFNGCSKPQVTDINKLNKLTLHYVLNSNIKEVETNPYKLHIIVKFLTKLEKQNSLEIKPVLSTKHFCTSHSICFQIKEKYDFKIRRMFTFIRNASCSATYS